MNRLFRLSGLLVPATVGLLGVAVVGIIEPDGVKAADLQNSPMQVSKKPTDWSFQSLRSLVERYGCIVPNRAFKFNRPATRYELAVVLNECLSAIDDRFLKEDLETVRALKTEFKPELETLKANVGGLDARTPPLEAQKFPTPHGEVTHGFQFSDVQPTDWAYQSLKSLVQNTGCLVGNPVFFEPNRATTRNELAMGLNACLNAMGSFDTEADQKTAQALQTEFKSELNSINERVNLLNSQTKSLKSQQFSTTTKIQGQVVFSFQGGVFR